MLSHVEAIKRGIQGLTLETEELKESQGLYQVLKNHPVKRNLDQDHAPETSLLRKGQNHVQRKDTAKEVCQSHDHALVHTAVGPGLGHQGTPGLGHLDTRNHALGHIGNLLYLEIFEGFPLLVGKEVWAHSEDIGQDHAPDLVDHVQGEEVLQGGGSRVQDLEDEGHVQGQDHDCEVGDLGHEIGDHGPHPEIESEIYQGQNPAQTQETEEEAGAKADLGQSQKKKHSPVTLYQLPV